MPWAGLRCVIVVFSDHTHFPKVVTKFYYRPLDLIINYTIFLNLFSNKAYQNGDLVYKLKRIVGKPNFSDQFKKTIKRCRYWDTT